MGQVSVDDGIAIGSYGMDSHDVQRVIANGMVKNEGGAWIYTPQPYMISYRSMTPDPNECINLLVPVCLSASHIAYGSIRMEPVFMALGEAAGFAASMAAKDAVEVQQIDVQKLKDSLDLELAEKFTDVPTGYWAENAIYKIYDAGITTGCSKNPLKYCPEDPVTRAQMAIFLERGIHNSDFVPPPATGIFNDVPLGYWAAAWIEQFYDDGITTGCRKNPPEYCPDAVVTRAQMAIFLLRSKHGNSYVPPPASGIFADVPVYSFAADWIEQLYREGITTGCQKNPLRYCPGSSVTRAQMAVFIVKTFNL